MKEVYNIFREDILWSEHGDFIIENGDIKDSRVIPGSGFLDEIMRRLKSAIHDWKLEQDYGANLNIFEGEQNNEETWLAITNQIVDSLTRKFLMPNQIEVNVIPATSEEIAIRIDFSKEIQTIFGIDLPSVKMVYNMTTNNSFITR